MIAHQAEMPRSNNGHGNEDKKSILKARAVALAREPEHDKAQEAYVEVIEFGLAQERYALEARYVGEVYPFRDLTPLPCTPPFVRGIVNVRGRILAVIDLKKFFGLPENGITDLHRIIVVHTAQIEVGILADDVIGVRSLPLAELQPSLPTMTSIPEDYLKGVTADRLVVLDVAAILADEKIVVHEEVQI